MGENRGKQFEEQVRKALEAVTDSVVLRLHDQTSGYLGSSNPCDFIFYRYPSFHMIECKSCYGNTLPFSNITDKQLDTDQYDQINGCYCWLCVWFIDHDQTVLIPMRYIRRLKAAGQKSYNITKDSYHLTVPGKKKRVLFDYDFEGVLD